MNFDPRGTPNIIELSSATHPSIIKYGTKNDETDEYVITVRVTYGDLEGLEKELMRFAGAKIATSKGIPMSRVMELSNDVGKIIDFFEKSTKENLIFTKDDCMEEFPADLCKGEYENIIVTTILNKKNASSSVLKELRKGPVEVKSCGYCGKAASLLCARCKEVAYCDRKCQKAAWPAHKAVCVRPEGCAVPVAAVRAPSAAASVPARAPSAAASVPARAPSAPARAPSAAASVPSRAPSVEESNGSSLPGPNADPIAEGGRRKRRRKTLKKNKKGRHSRKA